MTAAGSFRLEFNSIQVLHPDSIHRQRLHTKSHEFWSGWLLLVWIDDGWNPICKHHQVLRWKIRARKRTRAHQIRSQVAGPISLSCM